MVDSFKSTSSVVTSEKIVRPHIASILKDVIKSVQRKKHDGNKVTDKTISNWKECFPWLKIEPLCAKQWLSKSRRKKILMAAYKPGANKPIKTVK